MNFSFLVHHLLRGSADRAAEREALVVGPRRWTFAQLWLDVEQVAASLVELGLNRSDRVGVWLPAGGEQVISLLAISAAGGALVPIHISWFPQQVAHIVADGELRMLITHARGWADLQPHLEQLPQLETVMLVDAGPAESANAATDASSPARGANDRQKPHCVGWPLHPDAPPAPCREFHPLRADRCIDKDLAAILYTSGSTGLPKGVMLSHANLVSGASIVSDYLHITEDDRILAVLPFSFDAGLNQLTTALQQSATVVMQPFVLAKQIVQQLQRERITGLAGVPTLWGLLAQSELFQQSHFPDLRYITNTGGHMPATTLATLRRALPTTRVFLMYGLTEAFRSTYLPPEELDRRPSSMGKAIPNTEILVVNDEGRECRAGEIGELVHHGPTVALGYWRRPEATAAVWKPHPFPPPGLSPLERVCYSGDLVRKDEDGFLYYVGRRDNQIKTAGFRVSPTEIEEVLYASGQVAQAAVIGLPDELLGQRIVACVVPLPDQSLIADDLQQFCAARLPQHMIPKQIEILDQLPITSSSKVDYGLLRRQRSEGGTHGAQ